MERPEGSSDTPPGFTPMSNKSDKAETSSSAPAAASSSSKSTPAPAPAASASKSAPAPAQEKSAEKEVETADESMEVDSDANAEKEAGEEKVKGNAAYKARKFDEAIQHYSKAWELYPKDVTFLTNLSGEPKVSFPSFAALRLHELTGQLSTLSKRTTRNVLKHARRPSRRDATCGQTTRSLPSRFCQLSLFEGRIVRVD